MARCAKKRRFARQEFIVSHLRRAVKRPGRSGAEVEVSARAQSDDGRRFVLGRSMKMSRCAAAGRYKYERPRRSFGVGRSPCVTVHRALSSRALAVNIPGQYTLVKEALTI